MEHAGLTGLRQWALPDTNHQGLLKKEKCWTSHTNQLERGLSFRGIFPVLSNFSSSLFQDYRGF
jgi:hypothetical protein